MGVFGARICQVGCLAESLVNGGKTVRASARMPTSQNRDMGHPARLDLGHLPIKPLRFSLQTG
jgi:hypothetical protein